MRDDASLPPVPPYWPVQPPELSPVDFWQFLKELDAFGHDYRRQLKQDEFLDAYSLYLKDGDGFIKVRVQQLASELANLDPTFQFDVLL